LPLTTVGQETRWANSTTSPASEMTYTVSSGALNSTPTNPPSGASPHGADWRDGSARIGRVQETLVRVQLGWSLRDGERRDAGRPVALPQQSVESRTSQAAATSADNSASSTLLLPPASNVARRPANDSHQTAVCRHFAALRPTCTDPAGPEQNLSETFPTHPTSWIRFWKPVVSLFREVLRTIQIWSSWPFTDFQNKPQKLINFSYQ